MVTGNLHLTPLASLYRLAEISPLDVHRDTIAMTEKFKQEVDDRKLASLAIPIKSRKSFMTNESLNPRLARFLCKFEEYL